MAPVLPLVLNYSHLRQKNGVAAKHELMAVIYISTTLVSCSYNGLL